jgi:hypothetical protein
VAPGKAINPEDLAGLKLYFSVFDPLNTAGSLVLNQDPNAPDFQKSDGIAVSGTAYHRSRSCVILNEEPIYIAYTQSAFGFVGRSVYQRALFPLKSFIQSMITADNVISVTIDESIETLNMTNTDTAMTTARKNILENIASAADMPAHMLNNETFAEGFGEGTEDAKAQAQYVNGIREDMQPLYDFFDRIVQYRAWNPEFYATVQAEFKDYANTEYTTAFMDWKNSFKAVWPSLLIEPESERSKTEKVKLDAIIGIVDSLSATMDPDNKALLFKWAADNFNEQKMLFKAPLILDWDALAAYEPPAPVIAGEPGQEKA